MGNRHMFPAGNTSKGFINYFKGIIPDWEENKRLYILKGGPGVGKNTFMKRLGDKAQEKGYEAEYFHCASDNDSLDAVRIPYLGLTLLDGTAPHIIDPVVPGAVDQIWNLGMFLNEDKLAERKEEIINISKAGSFSYERTFTYLEAAGILDKNTRYIYRSGMDYGKLQNMVRKLLGPAPKGNLNMKCDFRRLFSGAFTPSGLIDYTDTVMRETRIISLKGPSSVSAEFLKLCIQYAKDWGLHGEVFYSPLLPEEPAHFNIKDLGLSITTKPLVEEEELSLDGCLDETLWGKYKETLVFQENQKNILLDAAVSSLKASKKLHDELEEIYSGCIDFDGVSEYTEKMLKKIIERD